MTTFASLLAKHIGAAFAKQITFADYLGDRNWSVDIKAGTVGFGEDLEFPMQLLGTEAEGDGTWLWAWANEASGLPPSIVQVANQMRELGKKQGVPELTDRSFSLDMADGHALSMVASGLYGKCCYYRGPYDGGALFFLVLNVPAEILQPAPVERALTVLSEVISNFTVDHFTMAESFLKSQGFAVKATPAELIATRSKDQITLTFDELRRMTNMKTTIHPK